MNWDTIAGRWTDVKGKVRGQWGKLTDDDLDVIAGRRDQLVGLIQRGTRRCFRPPAAMACPQPVSSPTARCHC
ncbi:MAG: CsbD family protein [Gemmatimonadetes bacterium]|nr:CsbD family protein [Gemmatimonadota bacterium]